MKSLQFGRVATVFASLVVVTFSFGLGGCSTCRPAASADRRFAFALIGDVPYTDDAVTNLFPNMIGELNRARIEFVVHDGDIKSGASPCTDETLLARLQQFDTMRHPLVYVPGDNEWTDCGTKSAGGFEPTERLNKVRELFMRDDYALGERTLKLTRQSSDRGHAEFRENVRWTCGGIVFAGFNVPGAINNFGKGEFATRNAANLAWLRETFAVARRAHGAAVMLIIQANPFPERGSTNRVHAGFRDFLRVLEEETLAFRKPVVLVHGDSHYFRIDKPLVGAKSKRRIENFTRVETFGNPDAHWLHVTVDPRDPQVFTFRQRIVVDNLVDHSTPVK